MQTIVLALIFIIALSFLYGAWRAAPWVPIWKSDIERFIRFSGIGNGQRVYDLGCGDGRVVYAAAAHGADACGYEVAILPYLAGKFRALFSPFRKRCSVRFGDFWLASLADADVVFFFLTPKVLEKIREKFERELRPGAKVISYVWPIGGWQPARVDTFPGRPTLFLYQR